MQQSEEKTANATPPPQNDNSDDDDTDDELIEVAPSSYFPIPQHAEPTLDFDPEEYRREKTSMFLHKRARPLGYVSVSQLCVLKKGVIIRGDIAGVTLGDYVVIGCFSSIRPPFVNNTGADFAHTPYPTRIGNHVYIGNQVACEAGTIGSLVIIGDGCVLGANSIVGHCCLCLPGCVVPANVTLNPYCVYAGNPAVIVGRLNEDSARVDIPLFVAHEIGKFYENVK